MTNRKQSKHVKLDEVMSLDTRTLPFSFVAPCHFHQNYLPHQHPFSPVIDTCHKLSQPSANNFQASF